MRNEQIRSIEWLRAVAAIFVVAYHPSQGIEFRTGFLTSKLTDFGASGVDIFFVISGFIMTVTTAGRPLVWHEFLTKRMIRLMPIYWTLTLIKAASLVALPSLVLFSVFSLPNIVTSLLLVPYDTPGRGVVPLIIVAWTLEIELMFYVAFAVSKQLCGDAWMVAVAGCFGAIVTAAALYPGSYVLRFYAQPVIFEFLFGIALALLFLRGVRLPGALAMPLLAVAAATLLVMPGGHGAVRLMAWGLPAAIIVGSAVSIEQRYGAWRWRPMVSRQQLILALSDAFSGRAIPHVAAEISASGRSGQLSLPHAHDGSADWHWLPPLPVHRTATDRMDTRPPS